jgi:hypothetical protein
MELMSGDRIYVDITSVFGYHIHYEDIKSKTEYPHRVGSCNLAVKHLCGEQGDHSLRQ